MLTRRSALAICSSVAVCAAASLSARSLVPVETHLEGVRARIGGRLGVHVLDTHTGRRLGFDDDSRYAMASTFKLLLAAAVLARVDKGQLSLGQPVSFSEKDMLSHAPVTSKLLDRRSATVQELCEAVVGKSDNPAANLLLSLIDGPPGFTRFVRSLGDEHTRLDRIELELNTNIPGDPRDTTTPRAMVDSMAKVLTGDALFATSRGLLTQWLIDSTTGLQRIRAGVPAGWQVGDKTGTGANGAVNDLAIIWPPGRRPVIMAIYLSESKLGTDALSAVHVEVARALLSALGLDLTAKGS